MVGDEVSGASVFFDFMENDADDFMGAIPARFFLPFPPIAAFDIPPITASDIMAGSFCCPAAMGGVLT